MNNDEHKCVPACRPDRHIAGGFKLPDCTPGNHVISCENIDHAVRIEPSHWHSFKEPVLCQCVKDKMKLADDLTFMLKPFYKDGCDARVALERVIKFLYENGLLSAKAAIESGAATPFMTRDEVIDETALFPRERVDDIVDAMKFVHTKAVVAAGTRESDDFFFNLAQPLFHKDGLKALDYGMSSGPGLDVKEKTFEKPPTLRYLYTKYSKYLEKMRDSEMKKKASDERLDKFGKQLRANVPKLSPERQKELEMVAAEKAKEDILKEAPDLVMILVAKSLFKANLELVSFGFCEKIGNIFKIHSMMVHRPAKVEERMNVRHPGDRSANNLAASYVHDFQEHLYLNSGIRLLGYEKLDLGAPLDDTTMTICNCTFQLPETLPVPTENPPKKETSSRLDEWDWSGKNVDPVMPGSVFVDNSAKCERLVFDMGDKPGWKGPDESKTPHQNLTDFFTHDAREKKK